MAKRRMGLIVAPDSGIRATSVTGSITLRLSVHGGMHPQVSWARPCLIKEKLASHPLLRFPGFGREGGPVRVRGGK